MGESGDADAAPERDSASTVRELVLYLQVAFFGGVAVLAVGLLALAVRFAVLEGEYRTLALLVLLLLVGGPFSLLYLLPVATDPKARAELTEGTYGVERLSAGKAVVAAVIGAAAILAALAVGPSALPGLLVAVLLVTIGASALDPEWSFDAEERTLEYRDRVGDLDAVAGYRRVDVRGRAVLWLSYAGPNELGRPRLAVLPAAVADDVVAAVPEEPPEEASLPADERVAVAVTGLLFLGVAAGLVVLGHQSASADSSALVAFAGMPALLGVLLLYLAR